MDFFAGFRPLLFSYVLINGILITLQAKEGTLPPLFFPKVLKLVRQFIGARHSCHAGKRLIPGNKFSFVKKTFYLYAYVPGNAFI